MNTNQFTRVVLLALLGFGISAWADDLTGDQVKAQKVLSDLHQANRSEIQMGQIAKEKASSDQVRAYAQHVVKDHQETDQKVQDMAQKDGFVLETPKESGWLDRIAVAKDDHIMTDLSKKTGTDFDKTFTNAMIDDHKRDIDNLESVENSLKQPDVRDFIAKLLPTLQQYLDQAEQIQRGS